MSPRLLDRDWFFRLGCDVPGRFVPRLAGCTDAISQHQDPDSATCNPSPKAWQGRVIPRRGSEFVCGLGVLRLPPSACSDTLGMWPIRFSHNVTTISARKPAPEARHRERQRALEWGKAHATARQPSGDSGWFSRQGFLDTCRKSAPDRSRGQVQQRGTRIARRARGLVTARRWERYRAAVPLAVVEAAGGSHFPASFAAALTVRNR